MKVRHLAAHLLTLLATVTGIIGFGLIWDGFSYQNPMYFTAGLPLLFAALWWSGRELASSNLAARRRRMIAADQISVARSRVGGR